jgi:hypothetical protein
VYGDCSEECCPSLQSAQPCLAYLATLSLNRAKVCSVELPNHSKVVACLAGIHSRKVQAYLDKAASSSLNNSLVVYSVALGRVRSSSPNKLAGCSVAIRNRKVQGYLGKALSSSKAAACLVVANLGKHLSKGGASSVVVDLQALSVNPSNRVAAYSLQAKVNHSSSSNSSSSSQPCSLDRVNKGRSLALRKLLIRYGRKGED